MPNEGYRSRLERWEREQAAKRAQEAADKAAARPGTSKWLRRARNPRWWLLAAILAFWMSFLGLKTCGGCHGQQVRPEVSKPASEHP
jgi:hypothetical protein